MVFLQQWFNLSDPAVEEAIYDAAAMRRCVAIDLGREAAPDETTLLRFRHLLAKHHLGAPPSTKNQDKKRDPDMHQTKKGNQWHFGMKAHIGVD